MGTPEAQIKRIVLVGPEADPCLSATAIGTLYARGYIDQPQYNAGIRWRCIYAALWPMPWPKHGFGTPISEQRLAQIKREFALKAAQLTKEQYDFLVDVCVFDHRPTWCLPVAASVKALPEDELERAWLVDGLTALVTLREARAA